MLNFREIQDKNQIFFQGKIITVDDFEVQSLIGSGSFSSVYKTKTNFTNQIYAMKKINKHKTIKNDLEEQLHAEIKILCQCDHENIIRLYCALEDDEYVYLIMEYADSGTLYERLKKKDNFNEQIVAKYMACILKAINHLHTRYPRIIHRDLKPENILIHQGKLMISDFGWSSQHKDTRTTFCGTYEYLSPEMINGVEYDEKIDIWSLGVIMYELLTGRTPFKPTNTNNMHIRQIQKIIEQNILQSKIDIKENLSEECKEVLLSMLEIQPELRPSALQLYTYPFFKNQGYINKS